ncbi:hypothetical protein DYB31_006996 [Aphanomyces astaci]|uniref:Uncharacterized protein n=3 Tax=Aphanomyces astaci TaxID=112090 RepID=A0A397EI14_APHAT|nr:hypothetical protein DYB31_006996 [Aphanomyces astaci]
MTSASMPRSTPLAALPTLRVSIPIMKAHDGTSLFALKTKQQGATVPTCPPPRSNPHIDSLYSMLPPSQHQRYLLKKSGASRAKDKDTRSKARPGFRKGKWTDEESKFAEQMAHYFKEGLLPLEKGTMLRMYLAEKLNCEPMRITKKFTGDECIGKQIFRPMPWSPAVEQRIQDAITDLEGLEKAYLARIEEMPMHCMSTKIVRIHDNRPTKRSAKKATQPSCPADDVVLHDHHHTHDAASLLLGFFHQTQVKDQSPSLSDDSPSSSMVLSPNEEDKAVYRSKRKFSISHCVAEYEMYMQRRPRIDSCSLVSSN